MSYILITGASSGIGLSLAEKLAVQGEKLILVARRADRLEDLKKRFDQCEIIAADLASPENAKQVFEEIQKRGLSVKTLINNAGVGLFGEFIHTDLEQELAMMNLNMLSLVALTKYFLIPMQKAGRGRIINVSSIASFMPGPQMSIYYATKAFVTSFTQSLAFELRQSPIEIQLLTPGPTATEFEKAAQLKDNSTLFERLKAMTADEVADFVLQHPQKKWLLPGFLNRISVFLGKHLPVAWVMWVVNKIQGKKS